MSKKSISVSLNGADESLSLIRALGTAYQLGWEPKYAGVKAIVAYTPGSWKKWSGEVTIEINAGQLNITSKLVHNETWDIKGRNKKNIADFLSAYETIKAKSTKSDIEKLKTQLTTLQESTIIEIEKQAKDAAEVEKVMNFSTSNLYLTYGIIGINTIIFLLMVINGMNLFAPNSLDVLKWGANYPVLTFGGEWWRLFTSVFLHFGILHLLLNMYALYFIGSYLEPLLGKTRFIVAYLCAGVAASLVSVLWHQENGTVSAGASGAIFGMFGVFLSLLTTNIIPKQVKSSILQSILFFVIFNVFYGFRPNSGIDNAAHLGGLFSGMVIGYAYYFTFRQPSPQKSNFITSLVALGTFAVVFAVLQNKQTPSVVMDYNTGNVFFRSEKEETDAFYSKLDQFDSIQTITLENLKPDQLSNEEYINKLKNTALGNWHKAINLMRDSDSISLPPRLELIRQDYLEYAEARVEETTLLIKIVEENTDKYNNSIDSVQKRMRDIMDRIKKGYEWNPDSTESK